MESIKINGIEIVFPFKPYPLQKVFMNQVLICLKEKKNGLLESPTGTGKTLSLLCSSLAWLNKLIEEQPLEDIEESDTKKDSKTSGWKSTPQILYSSRTHAQLSQACKEMRRTHYAKMKGVVIGGRDHLCLNKDVMELETTNQKTHACRVKINSRSCPFYNSYEKKMTNLTDYTDCSIHDIEDLITLGKKHTCCPYYASKFLKNRADIVFMPYNYLLDPNSRKALSINVAKNIVIFDEGHNIERICEDSVSGVLRSEVLAICIKEIRALITLIKESLINQEVMDAEMFEKLQDMNIENICLLQTLLCELENHVDEAINGIEAKKMHPSNWIFDTLDKIGLKFGEHKKIFNAIDEIISYTSFTTLSMSQPLASQFANNLQRFQDFLMILFPETVKDLIAFENFKSEFCKKYRVFTEIEEEQQEKKSKRVGGWLTIRKDPKEAKAWALHLWCLSPSIGLKNLQSHGCHCILITSGTLAPLNSFQVELEVPFPVTLQNPHIIDKSQIGIHILSQTWNGVTLDSSYKNRDNKDHSRALGQTIVHFSKTIPGGLLLFFSSYAVMNNLIELWKEKDSEWKIYSSLSREKQIFLEPKNKNAFSECIEKFKTKVDEPGSKGAIFLGVCRGKLSEGLDLANQYCRGVLMVGLPFPAVQDPRVIIKKQYLQDLNSRELTPESWYILQMKRALNQAIGRIVRNKDDYGVVLLLDSRFTQHVDGLSKWMRNFVKNGSFKEISGQVDTFFRHHNVLLTEKKLDNFANNEETKNEGSLYCSTTSSGNSIKNIKKNEETNKSLYFIYSKSEPETKDSFKISNKRNSEDVSSYSSVISEPIHKKRKPNIEYKTIKFTEGINSVQSGPSLADSKPKANIKSWVNHSPFLKNYWCGTSKFKLFCTTIMKFKRDSNLVYFSNTLKNIFEDMEQIKKREILLDLCTALAPMDRKEFLHNCGIDTKDIPESTFMHKQRKMFLKEKSSTS